MREGRRQASTSLRAMKLNKKKIFKNEASFEAGLGLWKLEQNSIYISQRRGPFLVLKREEPADAQTWASPVFDQN